MLDSYLNFIDRNVFRADFARLECRLRRQDAPPIFFGKENAPRPVEKKRFSFGFVVPASIGRYRSSVQLKRRLRLTNLVPAFYCKCLREVQQPPNCAPISGGPRSRPRPVSLAPAGQFTFSRPTSKRQTSSTARVRQQGCDRQYEVLVGRFLVKSFVVHQSPAVRRKLPTTFTTSANTTPAYKD